jgi:hypothetical protein
MGVVWLAEQRGTGRAVALKVLPPARVGSEAAAQRFEREVTLASRLEHPGIAAVFDGGTWAGGRYYAMAYVEGVSLDRHPAFRDGEAEPVVRLIAEAAEAMQHAHQRGVIHRDLKPTNIMVREDGTPVVVDFGLAKALDDAGTSLDVTGYGDSPGTPAYMAPEQAAGDGRFIDTRADVYSLGTVLYVGLVGDYPVTMSGSLGQMLRDVAEGKVRRPGAVGKTLPTDLEAIVMKALAHDPADRYGTAGEFAADLRRWLEGDPVQAQPQTLAYVLRRRGRQFFRKHRRGVAIAAGLLLATAAGLGWWSQQGARVPIYTDPPGALIWINGEPHYCPTNCRAFLEAGRHEITLRKVAEGAVDGVAYRDVVRVVEVGWGGYRFEGNQSVVLPPAFRYLRFEADTPTAEVTIAERGGGATVYTGAVPSSTRLDAGLYTMRAAAPGSKPIERDLEIIGGSDPRVVRLRFTQRP